MFLETPVYEDRLVNSMHAEDDILSKAADIFYSRKDYNTARKLYELASTDNNGFSLKGSAYAKLRLAYMMHHLRLSSADLVFRYYSEAHHCGRKEAGNNIGCLYYNGELVQQSFSNAFSYFLEAATHGNMYAQYNTARCYKKGYGIQQSFMEALNWYTKSANQGFAHAKDRVLRLNKKGYFIEETEELTPVAEKRLALIKRKDARHSAAITLDNQALFIANMND